jgi:enoyl-CoA hydratase/carnithine racemase
MLASVNAASLCMNGGESSSIAAAFVWFWPLLWISLGKRQGHAMSVMVQHEERLDGGRLARLTIDNASKLNSLNRALMAEIIEAADGLAADPQLRLVVLTGAGERAFVGGADIGEIAALDPESAREFITLVHRCCDAFRRLPVPVIARIDGYALGAGLELACACDLRVASGRALFGMPEVRIGIPSVVEAALLPKLIGHGRARRLLLTGETIGAAEALAWGLVDVVAPPEVLDEAVEDLAGPILAAGPIAIRLQKSLILDWEELPTAAAVQRGIDCFVGAYDTDEPARMAGATLAELRARRQRR